MLNKIVDNAIIRTLAYSDVFNYPLGIRELWKFLNVSKPIDKAHFKRSLYQLVLSRKIGTKSGFFFLIGREKNVAIRLKRKKISSDKFLAAEKAVKAISLIPTVKLVGVSGSLSLKNARAEDDIDLFIITSGGSLWITRFLVNIILLLKGYKRSPEDLDGADLICPNLFISESQLCLSKRRQNLFSAREIAQLSILLDRDNTYKKFLAANLWIRKFLPNLQIPRGYRRTKKVNMMLETIDKIFYAIQFLYMSNRITGEEINIKAAFFHPQDKGKIILKLYKTRYKKYCETLNSTITNFPNAFDTFNSFDALN